MKIKLKYLEGIREGTGEKETELILPDKREIKLFDLVLILIAKYGRKLEQIFFFKKDKEFIKAFKERKSDFDFPYIRFAINGRINVFEKDITIKDGDEIIIFPPLIGG
ncbi:MAG: MoaD/ThiS family protein [Promethearchaeota archaeon]